MNKFSHISIENHPASNILRHIRTPKVGRKIPWQTIYPAQWANNTEKEERHQHRWRQGKKCALEKNEKQRVQFSVKPVLASGIRYVKKNISVCIVLTCIVCMYMYMAKYGFVFRHPSLIYFTLALSSYFICWNMLLYIHIISYQ